jgi:chromosome segregation ATPase
MELPTMARTEDGTQEASAYRSPMRVLARAFEKSRDRWKQKYQWLQKRLKDRLTDVRDLRRSRDRWRAKAEALEQEANALKTQLKQRVESSPPALS